MTESISKDAKSEKNLARRILTAERVARELQGSLPKLMEARQRFMVCKDARTSKGRW
jgi:hypothetical protein